MTIAADFIAELDAELPPTRKLLSRVPDGVGDWKPHPKSAALGHLAQLVSRMPMMMTEIVSGRDVDLAIAMPYSFEKTETLVAEFDRHVAELREALSAIREEDFALTWKLLYGGEVVGSGTRKDVLRNTINHFAHHRGQLTVYLRMHDVPIPSLYGPSADEPA